MTTKGSKRWDAVLPDGTWVGSVRAFSADGARREMRARNLIVLSVDADKHRVTIADAEVRNYNANLKPPRLSRQERYDREMLNINKRQNRH